MKKVIFLGIGLLVVIGAVFGISQIFNGSAAEKQRPVSPPKQVVTKSALQGTENKNANKTLVVYYSLTGNTKQIAQHIHDLVGGDIFELRTVQTYPEDHQKLINQAKKELGDGYLPELQGRLTNLSEYDVIYVGSPIWWGTDAPAVRTFLSQNDLAGKTVIPFVTHASAARSGGPGSGIPDISAQAKGAKALAGMHFYEDKVGDKQAVAGWLKGIDMLK